MKVIILFLAACAAVGQVVGASVPEARWERSAEGVWLPAHLPDDWQAGWIWCGKPLGEHWFRKTFSCDPATLRLAAFQWAADDGAEAFVNGTSLGEARNWNHPTVHDQVLPLLRNGTNEVVVRAWNNRSSSGFLGELDLVGKDGSIRKIGSGADWEGTEKKDGPWGRVREFMRKPQPPYGETPYVDYSGRNRGIADIEPKAYVPRPGERLVTEIRRANGAMHYFENGIEKPFVSYRASTTDARLRALRYMASMDRAGVRLGEVCTSLAELWREDGTIDGAKLDRRLSAALEFAPHMNLILSICVDPPAWYAKSHDGDRYALETGRTGAMSYASETVRRDVCAALGKILAHLKAGPHYGRLAGFGLSGGDDGQFMQWSGYGYRNMGDYSAPMRRLFGREIPSAERRRGDAKNLFLDETKDADAIAYNRLYGSVAADCMLACAATVKRATDREKIVGAYYGKFFSIAGYLECGELAIRKVLASPDVDYLIAVEYTQRLGGLPHSISAPTESYALHGKMFMDEADIRTFLDGQKNWGYAGDERGTASMIRKMFALSFVRGHSIHWFDLFGGWFDHPAIEKTIGDVQKVAARHQADPVTPAEIAVVCDEESLIHARSFIKRETGRTMNHLQNGVLGRIGAPFDLYFADDLATAPQYKMYVFLNCFAPTPEARAEMERIRASGAKCIAVNPGDRVPTPAEYRAAARAAGVHVYSSADDVMVYVGRGLLGVHAGSAGEKTIVWPRRATFRDAITGELLGCQATELALRLEKNETRLVDVCAEAPVDTMADTWVATDGLGRSLPTLAEAGPVKGDRTVAIFTFLWHHNDVREPAKQGPFDISKMLAQDPDLMKHPDSPLFGPWRKFHHWGEPLLGYYIGTDKAVYRRHAQWLSDAGVDAVIFDTTNGPIYEETVRTLLEAFAEHEAAGGKAPKIAFMCPFSRVQPAPPDRRGTSLLRLWETIYKPGVHPELWFRWEGKPLVLSYPSYCAREPIVMLDAVGDVRKDGLLRKPVRLQGHVLGQAFTVDRPFDRVQAGTPTHRSPTLCGAKLVLRRDGPGGEIVASCVADRIADNDMTTLFLKTPAPAGTYLLELSEPVGTVSWWSRTEGAHRGAYADGKPVSGFRHLAVRAYDPEEERMKTFFTFRAPGGGAGYNRHLAANGKAANGAWAWAETYPQSLHRSPEGKGEMVSVSVALNATATKGPVPMNCGEGVVGRRWHDGANDPDPAALAKGLCFQEQWNRALGLDPRLVFVTGWNEWIMSRLRKWNEWEIPAGNFVDQYNAEFSRDAEPVRGFWGDAYYWQLAANVRRYKGVRPIPPVVSRPVVIDGAFADWQAVGPEFRDDAGDPAWRDHPGWGKAGPYVDKSGRNDIVLAKVSRTGDALAFYVRTRGRLSAPTNDWMRLLVDADRSAATGWLGYDFLVERADGRTVLRRHDAAKGGFAWSAPVAEAACAIGTCEMELSLPIAAFGSALAPDGFDFKWEDNCLQSFDWTDLMLHGDTAPNGRFNYRACLRKQESVEMKCGL